MEEKKCVSCKLEKPFGDFQKNKSKKDGLQDICKSCRKVKYNSHKDTISEYKKEWYQKKSDIVKDRTNKRYHSKKDDINRERRDKYNTIESFRNDVKDRNKKYYEMNSETLTQKSKLWVENNKDRKNEISRKHYGKYKVLMVCRRLIKRTMKYFNTKKENSTIELLGYTPKELKENIESKFIQGMSWENYGEWHIDHIKPISVFDKNESPSVVNSLDNLQPLWAFDNLSKGNKYLQK
jgi:hypothetical protein